MSDFVIDFVNSKRLNRVFKGDAEVIVTEATVVLALQEYFERRTLFGFTPLIKSISLDTRSYGPEGRRFKIEMTENDKSLVQLANQPPAPTFDHPPKPAATYPIAIPPIPTFGDSVKPSD